MPERLQHVWKECPETEHDRPGGCKFCDGGLGWCAVCDGAESELTRTDCPGRKLTPSERERVRDGRLDFVRGRWVVRIQKTEARNKGD